MRPDAAYIVADILSDPNASYFSRKIHRVKDWKVSYKTGTTNDAKDGWLMGFTTQYAAGIWVGYHNRQIAMRGFMETMTQPIMNGWMTKAHENLPGEERARPSGVKTLPAYVVRTHVGVGSVEPSPANDLYPSWYEQPKKANGKKKVIDIVSNKLATDCTPNLARKEIDEAYALSFSGDRFVGTNVSTEENDDIHKCDDLRPAIRLTVSPSGSGYQFTADVTAGTHPLSSDQFKGTVNFLVDGQVISGGSLSIDSSGIVGPVSYDEDFDGTRNVTAQVIDSVLYDSTSESIPIGGGASFNITEAEVQGGQTRFNWTGGSGLVTIFRSLDDFTLCSSNDGDCQVGVLQAPMGTQVYGKDSDDNETSSVTVTN